LIISLFDSIYMSATIPLSASRKT